MPQQPIRGGFQPVMDRVERAQCRGGGAVAQHLAAMGGLRLHDRAGLRRERGEIGRRTCRDEQGEHDAGQRRMQPAGEDAAPERDAEQRIGYDAIDMGAVERREPGGEDECGRQIARMQFARIEQRDHDDRADIVDDRGGCQEDAQFDRNPLAQHYDDRDGEGRIGRHRDAPAMRPRAAGQDQSIEGRRHHHAADRAGDRQGGGATSGEMADGEFALDLQPHDKEEDRQQAVIYPMLK